MSINDIFINQQIQADIKRKIQKNTTYMFPQISLSNKNKSLNHNNKLINSDKQLYFIHSSTKNNSNLTNHNFYSMNPKSILTNQKKSSYQIKNIQIAKRILEITQQKKNNNINLHQKQKQKHQKQRQNDFLNQCKIKQMKQTQRQINKFRTTFLARKSLNIYQFKQNNNANNNNNKKYIGNYLITKQLGHGGFAKVYQVIHKQSNLKYAMKQYNLLDSLQCYLKQVKVGQFYLKQFKNNNPSSTISNKNNSSIINYIQKIKNNKKGYVIQQLGGQNFSKIISEIKGAFHNKQRIYQIKFLPFYQKIKKQPIFISVITQICQGIQLLNNHGFVHCDLKLQNILIHQNDNQTNDFPTVKIIDFGSTFQSSKGLPKITITPEYMPPELLMQFDKNGQQGPALMYEKIDVWSIGCILFQLFTGIPLWFRYKCKICYKDRSKVDLGIFALTNRDYSKIIRKQQQLCQTLIKNIGFVTQQWQKYRFLLKQIFVMNPQKRISIQGLIQRLEQFQ